MGPALIIPLLEGVAIGTATATATIIVIEVIDAIVKTIREWLNSIQKWLKRNEERWWARAARALMAFGTETVKKNMAAWMKRGFEVV